ncbi:MAG TPA: GntR family transcriptional regulator [Lachnoclostridium sp.]|jgi:DNA-binding GntR family transcriptional regulator|nr:GntR family transcriptional regulator [Lachnoclostridium sp.]
MQVKPRKSGEIAREYALRIIKDNIISLDLEPGSSLNDMEVSTELGVSRTPVREAIMELSKSKIIEVYPQKGSRIALIDLELVNEARFLRLVLERAIVELACEMATPEDIVRLEENLKLQEFYAAQGWSGELLHFDDQFHEMLFSICKKDLIYNISNGLSIHSDRLRRMALFAVKDLKVVSDHRRIVDAIRAKDRQLAGTILVEHLTRYIGEEKEVREVYPHYFKD